MFGALISGGAGARLQMLSEGYPMAPWEISQLDRHMLSYCVSLENTPTAVRICDGGAARSGVALARRVVSCALVPARLVALRCSGAISQRRARGMCLRRPRAECLFGPVRRNERVLCGGKKWP